MLLTPLMAAVGIGAALAQWVAHQLVRDRSWATPIARYTIGAAICLVAFSAAYASDSRQDAITGIWYVFGASAIGTWLGYIGDPQPTPHDAIDLDKLAGYIVSEHNESD